MAPPAHKAFNDIQQQLLVQLVQKELNNGSLEAYGRQLLQACRQRSEPELGGISIGELPILVCQANQGASHHAETVAAVWQLIRLSAKLLDDVEDGEITTQVGEIINTAVGMLFAAQLVLDDLKEQGLSPTRVHRLTRALNQVILHACAGQHLSLTSRVETIDLNPNLWLEAALAKSGELLAWAAWSGALVAGVDEEKLTCYYEFGYHLGALLQVADDFNGVWQPTAINDLSTGCFTLPVCYAFSVVTGKEREALNRLLKRAAAGDTRAIEWVRQQLTDLGAQAYLLVVGKMQYQQALTALQCATPPLPDEKLVLLLKSVWPALVQSGN